MSAESLKHGRRLLQLVLLHAAAAGVCFAVFTLVPIGGCMVLMMIDNDPGGPLFFPIFVMGVFLLAAVITAFIAGAALLSGLLRRRRHVPLWLPPLAVFGFATGSVWLLGSGVHPAVPPIVGIVVALMFIAYWTGISTVRSLPWD